MTVHRIPLICSPLVNQAAHHLTDLKLADQPSEDCDSEVDVLIGKDFYRSFFTGDVKREESGPVARKSYMGVIVPLPQTLGSDTDVHLVRSHTLWLDTTSCDDRVTDKRIYDPLLEQRLMEWIDKGVPTKEVVKLSEED
ncbi:hypothetical protein pdam_00006018, partial [Pocillopora damicornis]